MDRFGGSKTRWGRGVRGFTLVELLVVITIIALLMSIAIPSLSRARENARRAATQAMLRAIDTGLEMFSQEFDRYPQSRPSPEMTHEGPDNGDLIASDPTDAKNDFGAQLLAQALFGWDTQGYADRRKWKGITTGLRWYDVDGTTKQPVDPERADHVYATADHFKIMTADETTPDDEDDLNDNAVLVDTGRFHRPILYYRANRNRVYIAQEGEETGDNHGEGIYSFEDNDAFYRESIGVYGGADFNDTTDDPDDKVSDQFEKFTAWIFNPDTVPRQEKDKIDKYWDAPQARPYNKDRFILIAAGPDGQYGTVDDVTNFEGVSFDKKYKPEE